MRPDLSWLAGSADISTDGVYRFSLWRRWAPRNNGQGHVVFVMLNPSTADATDDDATIRRCIGFAKRWGYGGLEVVNLFAYRTADPRVLRQQADRQDVTGDPRNIETIVDVCAKNGPVVLAWGANAHQYWTRALAVQIELQRLRVPIYAFPGQTKNGEPFHPLRLPAALPFRPLMGGRL